jgi:hypothetical protein
MSGYAIELGAVDCLAPTGPFMSPGEANTEE